jgi:hypothetical protein
VRKGAGRAAARRGNTNSSRMHARIGGLGRGHPGPREGEVVAVVEECHCGWSESKQEKRANWPACWGQARDADWRGRAASPRELLRYMVEDVVCSSIKHDSGRVRPQQSTSAVRAREARCDAKSTSQ